MTIAEQMQMVAAALGAWAKDNKGRVFVASDAIHAIEELRNKPGAPTCAVLWWSRKARGDIDALGRRDNEFKVVVSRGRGFKVVQGEALTVGVSGGRALYELVEEAEAIVLGLRVTMPDEDQTPEDTLPTFEGAGPWNVTGLPLEVLATLDAAEIRFTLPAQAQVQLP